MEIDLPLSSLRGRLAEAIQAHPEVYAVLLWVASAKRPRNDHFLGTGDGF
jgi:hypothetical protein